MIEIDLLDTITDWYLVIHEASGERVVTVLEILSRANKSNAKGRRQYLRKRDRVASVTHKPGRDRPAASREAD